MEAQKENLIAQLHRLEAMGTGPGLGGIPDPNPNPNHASDAKYKHPNSHDHPNSKLKQAYFVCGDERLEVPLPHPKGWGKRKPAKTTGKAYHANQWYYKKAKQGSKPCSLKSCDRRSRSDQAGDWRNPLGGTPETNVGKKLALSLDSVAAKSTEPAEAAANAAAAVGQAAPSVEAATAAEAVGKAEPATAAVNAAEVVGQTEPTVKAVNTADTAGQQEAEPAVTTVTVLRAEAENARLLRSVARKMGNAPTPRAKLLHKLRKQAKWV